MALNKKNILKIKSEIDLIFKKGKTLRGGFLYLKKIKNNFNYPRFVIIIPSKIIKKASDRNNLKRIISELIRANFLKTMSNNDFIISVAKKATNNQYTKELIDILNND